jgi:hypothetical protein
MMTNDDELARLRRAFSEPAGPAPDPAACPPADRILLAVRGELPPDGMRQIVEHMAACSACAEDWRLAMAFEEESRIVPDRAYEPTRSVAARLRPWLTAVAAVLVLTVAGIEMRNQTQKPPVYRGNGQTVESALPAGAALPRERFVLDWKPVSGAATYDLVVTTSDLSRTIADLPGLTKTEYQVPAAGLAGLPSGTEIGWKVTPVFPDGGTLQARTFKTKIR